MTFDDLIIEAREDYLDDSVQPYLWSDKQLLRFTKDAVNEACLRAPLLHKTYRLPIRVGMAEPKIDPSIRTITSAHLESLVNPLQQTDDAELNAKYGLSWRERHGSPRHFLRLGRDKIRLVPIPDFVDVLVLHTTNVPDDDFCLEEDIDETYHRSLIYWIVYRALSFNDADTHNQSKAEAYKLKFDDMFGPRKSALYDKFMQNRTAMSAIINTRMA